MSQIQTIADVITIAGLPVAVVTLLFSFWEARANRRATSAAIYLAVVQSMREEWRAFDKASPDDQEDHLAEVLNLTEIACGIEADGILAGRSGKFLQHSIDGILNSIDKSPNLQALVSKLRTHEHTFVESERYRARRLRKRTKDAAHSTRGPP
ncbi:hypothetical protein [Mesorhizobium sp. M0408]|uniref:hypothetical protein n=1 Tax=Mesorhizobium sp. M0408 TaxID=2956942 RepID=UPI00333D60C3